MAQQPDMVRAKATFDTLCRTMESNEWKFAKDEEKLCVDFGIQGDDLPVQINMHVDARREVVVLLSQMPFSVGEDKRMDLAVAVSVVNSHLVHGCFDFDVRSGKLVFRMSNSYFASTVGQELFDYMAVIAYNTVEAYNDKFLMLAKDMLSLEKFLESENG